MEDVEGEVRHAGSEAEARGITWGACEVGLAATVTAPAQRAPQQRRRCEEADERGRGKDRAVLYSRNKLTKNMTVRKWNKSDSHQ